MTENEAIERLEKLFCAMKGALRRVTNATNDDSLQTALKCVERAHSLLDARKETLRLENISAKAHSKTDIGDAA